MKADGDYVYDLDGVYYYRSDSDYVAYDTTPSNLTVVYEDEEFDPDNLSVVYDTSTYLYDANGDKILRSNTNNDDGVDTADTSTDGMNDSAYDSAGEESTYEGQKIYKSGGTYDDATSAVIGAGSSVTAGGSISVVSSDVIDATMLAGTVAIGGTAGVGVGLAVSVLFSNVVAEVENGATLDAAALSFRRASSGADAVPTPETRTQMAIYDKAT
jgi:hypothetical protein